VAAGLAKAGLRARTLTFKLKRATFEAGAYTRPLFGLT
jgi:hypothetical protein